MEIEGLRRRCQRLNLILIECITSITRYIHFDQRLGITKAIIKLTYSLGGSNLAKKLPRGKAKFEEDKQVLLRHYDIKYVSQKAINGQALVVLDVYPLLDNSPLVVDPQMKRS